MPKWIYLITASQIRDFVQCPKCFFEKKAKKGGRPKTEEDILRGANRKLLNFYKELEFSYLSDKEKKMSDSRLEKMLENSRSSIITSVFDELGPEIRKYHINHSLIQQNFAAILDEIIPKRVSIINEKKDAEIILEVMNGDRLNRPFENRKIGICARPDLTVIERYDGDVLAIPYEVKTSNPPFKYPCTSPIRCQLAADRLAIISMKKRKSSIYNHIEFPYYGMVFYRDGNEKKVDLSRKMDHEIINIATSIRELFSIPEEACLRYTEHSRWCQFRKFN